MYDWSHYPFKEFEEDEVPAETELVPSIPSIFSTVLADIRDVEYLARDRNVLRDGGLDRRIVRPFDGRSKSGPVIGGVDKSGRYQVTACRREHVGLIYNPEGGLFSQLGLCPHMVGMVLVAPNKDTYVGGPSHDSRMKCVCADLRAAWRGEEASRAEAGIPTEAERAAKRRAAANAGEDDEDAGEAAAGASSPTPSSSSSAAGGAGDEDEADAAAAAEGDGAGAGAGDAAAAEADQAASAGGSGRRSSRSGGKKKADGEGDGEAAAGKKEAPSAAALAAAAAAAAAEENDMDLAEPEEDEDAGAPFDAEQCKDTPMTVGEIWESLEAHTASTRKAVEKAWRLRLKQSEREKEELRASLVDAEERAQELEDRWKAEKDTNVKLWNRIESINATIDRMVRPTKK